VKNISFFVLQMLNKINIEKKLQNVCFETFLYVQWSTYMQLVEIHGLVKIIFVSFLEINFFSKTIKLILRTRT